MGPEVVTRPDGARREGGGYITAGGTRSVGGRAIDLVQHGLPPSVKITDAPSRKMSKSDTPWTVLMPDTTDARAGHGEEGQGRPPHHPHQPMLGVRAARSRVRGSGTRDLR
jgi:hypothetical protein